MNPFFQFFNRDRPPVDPAKKWAIRFKEYPRFPQIVLARIELPGKTLGEALSHRQSRREFSPAPLTLNQISLLLRYGAGMLDGEKTKKRAYPSGGALYPVELYITLLKTGEVPHGIYHYNVRAHSLEALPDEYFDAKKCFSYDFPKEAAAIIFFSAIPERARVKYGNLGYKYALIEAGHVSQNIYLVSEALGLKCCALGAPKEDAAHQLLGLEGEEETVFYAMAIGM